MTKAPRRRRSESASRRQQQATRAIRALLQGLGVSLAGELKGTPARAASLWVEHLLAGEGLDPKEVLGRGSKTRSRSPVSLFDVGVHLVCPHHLTVAFGEAHVAYLPRTRVAGFGALARLVRACTARLALQEDATQLIADTLVLHLGAVAAVVVIDALHPCHNVPHARSHRARAVTWGIAGDKAAADSLARLLAGPEPGAKDDCGCDGCA